MILLKASIKKLVNRVEKHLNVKFPEYQAKFYSNRRNFYIHMRLDNSLLGYENFKKLLKEVENFLNEHLPNKFISVFPPKLIYPTKWKHDYIISKKMAKFDNKFIPKHVPDDLKWYERDGLDTWHLQNKCGDFINNTDEHFKQMKITNSVMIRNDVSKDKIKQYQTLDHQEIMRYPPQLLDQICSSIFRNANRKDMHIKKETINEHFVSKNKKVGGTGRGRFIKKIRDDLYAEAWYSRFVFLCF